MKTKIYVLALLLFLTSASAAELDSTLRKGIIAGMHHKENVFLFTNPVVNNSKDAYYYKAELIGSRPIEKADVKSLDTEMQWTSKQFQDERTDVVFRGKIFTTDKDYYQSKFSGKMRAGQGGGKARDLTWDFIGQLDAQNLQLFVFGENHDLEGAKELPNNIKTYFRGERSRTHFAVGETISFAAFLNGKPYPLTKELLKINENEVIPNSHFWEETNIGECSPGITIPLKMGNSISKINDTNNNSPDHAVKIPITVVVNGKNIRCPEITVHYPYVEFDSENYVTQGINNDNFHENVCKFYKKQLGDHVDSDYMRDHMMGIYFIADVYIKPCCADFRQYYVHEETCGSTQSGFFTSQTHPRGESVFLIEQTEKGFHADGQNDLVCHFQTRDHVKNYLLTHEELSGQFKWEIPWVLTRTAPSETAEHSKDSFWTSSERNYEPRSNDSIVFAIVKQQFMTREINAPSPLQWGARKLGITVYSNYTLE
ncbi:MAG: hypothetical protein IJD43_07195 [Thermoguttaceae bacterium]|nr:hypothetical protein [Thermoguttaceae bacterium]